MLSFCHTQGQLKSSYAHLQNVQFQIVYPAAYDHTFTHVCGAAPVQWKSPTCLSNSFLVADRNVPINMLLTKS